MGRPITSRVKVKKPRIINKHIKEKNVLGYAYQDDFEIEIHPEQDSREYLNTLIHEMLHCFLPDVSEYSITRLANIMTEKIWRRRYRRMEK